MARALPFQPFQPDPSAAPTTLIGGCRLVRQIGAGGTSEVYEAVHVGLARTVAVKVLKPSLTGDALALERMRFEAQALARLDHPNILAVTDSGCTADGRPFLVMEHLRGVPLLRELRRRGCLPVAEAVALTQQVLAGLGAAHALGVVHRDIKLENLFLCEDAHGRRTIKILDFGIAKLMPGAVEAGAPLPPAIPSHEGVPVGTPRFLAPEQVMCRAVDARTDVYGAALVLYELIAGRDPFHHVDGYAALLQAHVAEDPRPPSALAPQWIDPAIDDVVLRGLAKRPDDRWATAEALSRALGIALACSLEGAPDPVRAAPARAAPARSCAVPILVIVASAVLSALATLGLCQVW
jgi:serine/threonine-protein kinase